VSDDPEVLTSAGVEVTQEMWSDAEAENERLRAENERLRAIIEDAADRANRDRARVATATARAIEKAIRADAVAPPIQEKP
jgi:hypothetical protein